MFPFDIDSLLNAFKENIEITRDDEGVIIKYKNIAPGMSVDMLKNMMENAMANRGKDLMRQFTGEDEEEIDEFEEDDEEDDDPGFRIEKLDDGTGLKFIPDDPDEIESIMESLENMFDPEMFKAAMEAVFKMFSSFSFGGDDDDEEEDEESDETDDDRPDSTGNFFYI